MYVILWFDAEVVSLVYYIQNDLKKIWNFEQVMEIIQTKSISPPLRKLGPPWTEAPP